MGVVDGRIENLNTQLNARFDAQTETLRAIQAALVARPHPAEGELGAAAAADAATALRNRAQARRLELESYINRTGEVNAEGSETSSQ